MSLMRPQTWYGSYTEIDTTERTYFIPSDFIPTGLAKRYYRHYVQGEIQTIETKTGWLGRMSAPGYLDCTEWEPGESEAELLETLNELYGPLEDEEGIEEES